MYIVNDDFNMIKVGDIVAFDIGGFLGSINEETTLVKVIEVIDREPFYDYEEDTYEEANPLVRYINVKTKQEGECDIAWLFTKTDVQKYSNQDNNDMILNNRIKMLQREFESE